MKRRDVITLVAAAAVAWPVAARAQQQGLQHRNPQNANAIRERIIRECDLAERTERPDPREGKKTGSRMFAYRACMAKHGQIE